MSDPCGRVGAGYGDDTWQPVCDLDAGHDGPCDWDPNRERWEREQAGVCVICGGAAKSKSYPYWCSEDHRSEYFKWNRQRGRDAVNQILQEAWPPLGVVRVEHRDPVPNTHYGLSLFDEAIAVEQARPGPSRLAWRPWRQKL